jgi:predicted dehydrogenase
MTVKPLQIGALGCADILTDSLFNVYAQVPEARLAAIGSRSLERAREYAAKHSVPRHYGSYQQVLEDPEVELVYVALPNGMHAEWTIRALQAGKPVICQKPICANEAEGGRILEVERATGLPLIEAWHFQYHPIAQRIRAILSSGTLGALRTIESRFNVPGKWVTAGPDNIRFQYELAGGATMDPGCYCVGMLRYVTGKEPRVTGARSRLISPDVDVRMEAELVFPGGLQGRLETSLDDEGDALDEVLEVTGENGSLFANSPGLPHWGDPYITLTVNGHATRESFERRSSFAYMWPEVVRVIRERGPIRTTAASGVRTARVIDDIYRAAGMRLRGSA